VAKHRRRKLRAAEACAMRSPFGGKCILPKGHWHHVGGGRVGRHRTRWGVTY